LRTYPFSLPTCALSLLAALTLWGCVDYAGPSSPCIPGAAQACTCGDGANGWQVCSPSGQWQSCVCDATPGGPVVGDPLPRVGTASLRVEPAFLDFSGTQAGQRAIRRVSVTNDGDTTALFSAELEETVKPEDQRRELSWDASQAPPQRLTLEPGQSTWLTVVYVPQDTWADDGWVHITELQGDSDPYSVRLLADGSLQDLEAPRRLVFGRTQVGRQVTRAATLRNVGGAVREIKRLQVLGSQAFSMCIQGQGEEVCADAQGFGALDRRLMPQEALEVSVTYQASAEGSEEASLLVRSNDPDERETLVRLIAGATEPCLELVQPTDGLDFGEVPLEQRRQQTLELRNCSVRQDLVLDSPRVSGDSAFQATLPGQAPVSLAPGETTEVTVTFTPRLQITHTGTLSLISNDPENSPLSLPLLGVGVPVDNCAIAVASATLESAPGEAGDDLVAPPLDTIYLDGSDSFDPDLPDIAGAISRYEWTVLQRPNGSTSPLQPQEEGRGARADMFLDLVGTYRFQLQVFDQSGNPACAPAVVVARVVADEDIHVQLVWNTPNDNDEADTNGTDLDLHLLHPNGSWNNSPWDCYWSNGEPDWGARGRLDDNPSLDIDDTDGAGPENINLDNPEAVPYRVGVFYFSSGGFGRSNATARVYLGGALAFEEVDVSMRDSQFWEVAVIDWARIQVNRVGTLTRGFP
jgi:hypothetical protein